MTVPPELPPGTLRCSVFLVGIDRGEAAIPFSSDVVRDPRIHVSESGDEPRMFLVIPARGQHCALVLVVHLGIRLIDAAGQFENVPRNVPPTFGTRTFLTRHYNFFPRNWKHFSVSPPRRNEATSMGLQSFEDLNIN